MEGNSGDMCQNNSYPLGYAKIYGYLDQGKVTFRYDTWGAGTIDSSDEHQYNVGAVDDEVDDRQFASNHPVVK